MSDVVQINATDIIKERPFTHPGHTDADLAILRYMVDRLCLVLEQPDRYAGRPRPVIFYQQEPDGRSHRVVICNSERLLMPSKLAVVGFFGQKRPNADLTLLNELGELLIAEFPQYSGLLSYSTLALENGNFSNLVVFTGAEAKNHWGASQLHARAAGKPSADYYASVRLYNGSLPAGLVDSGMLRLACVKYYDFKNDPAWRGERTFQ